MNTMQALSRKAGRVLEKFFYKDFYRIKVKANGMLSPKVYSKIYDVIASAPDNDVVEIGSGRGAGTVVIAKALKDSRKKSKVIAVEKFEGGSNVDFMSKDENFRKMNEIFDYFNVSDKIEIFPHYLTEANVGNLKNLISTEFLSCLIIDADGRLDIYLPALWSYLSDGCLIILDDYRENYNFSEKSTKYPLGRTKEVICFRLVNKLVELGYLKVDFIMGATVFARKGRKMSMTNADLALLHDQVASVEHEYAVWLHNRRMERIE